MSTPENMYTLHHTFVHMPTNNGRAHSNDWFVAAKRHDGMCTAPELRLEKYFLSFTFMFLMEMYCQAKYRSCTKLAFIFVNLSGLATLLTHVYKCTNNMHSLCMLPLIFSL